MTNKQPQTEKVILGKVYLQNGKIGFHFTGEAESNSILYFLESFVKRERKDYEDGFQETEGKDERGLD